MYVFFFSFFYQFFAGAVCHKSIKWTVCSLDCVQDSGNEMSREKPWDSRRQQLQVATAQHHRLHQMSHVGKLWWWDHRSSQTIEKYFWYFHQSSLFTLTPFCQPKPISVAVKTLQTAWIQEKACAFVLVKMQRLHHKPWASVKQDFDDAKGRRWLLSVSSHVLPNTSHSYYCSSGLCSSSIWLVAYCRSVGSEIKCIHFLLRTDGNIIVSTSQMHETAPDHPSMHHYNCSL